MAVQVVNFTIPAGDDTARPRKLTFKLQSSPVIDSTDLVIGEEVCVACAADGTGTVSLHPGDYKLEIDGEPNTSTISVPTSGTPHRLESLTGAGTTYTNSDILSGGSDWPEQTTKPSAPDADKWKFYVKSDGNFYKQDENGTETAFAAGSGITTVQEEGTSLTQRSTVNFIGNAVTAVDNSGSARTDVTISAMTASSTDTLTNKTIDANGTGNSITNIETADLAAAAKTGSDTAVVTGTAGTNGDLAQWNGDGDLVDGPTPPSGAIVGDTDSQSLTNKTLDDFTNTVHADFVHIEVRNESGATLSPGDAVYISGYSVGQSKTLVAKADASASSTMPAIGIINESIANNATGEVIAKGRIVNIDTSTYSEGDTLYVSETSGTLTSTKPTGAALVQSIATVLRSHASSGVLAVNGNILPYVTGFAATLLADETAAAARTTLGAISADSTDTLTNKTFDANATGNSLSNVETADVASGSKSGSDATLITGTAGTSGDLSQWNVDGDLVDGPTPPTGTIVGTTDTQTLTNKTLDADNNTVTNIGSSEIKAEMITGQTTAAAFASGDKFLIVSGGALEQADYDDLPSGGASLPVDDTTAVVRDPVDNTKLARIDAGAITTGTTRVITMGDRDVDLASGGTFAETSHNHAASAITSGTLAHERGGLEADVSAYSGLVKISAGSTSAVTDNSANWDTAYGWGDHSSAGYGTLSNVVEDTTPQLGGTLDCNGNDIGIDSGNSIVDQSGNDYLYFLTDLSAVNYIQVSNKATGGAPFLRSKGSDTNIDFEIQTQGTGDISAQAILNMNNNDITAVGDVGCGTITASGLIDTSGGNIAASTGDVSAATFSFTSPTGTPSVVTTDASGIMGENYALTGGVMATDVVSGSAGTSGNLVKWDANGEVVDASIVAADVKTTRTGVYRTLWVPASAMVPRTSSGAATGTVELVTNDVMLDTMDFDTTTEEGVGFWVNFGDQWGAGTVKVKFYWTAASGTGTVKWDIAGQSYADSDAIDQALGTEQGVTDTLITANDMHITSATSALTIADATAGEPVYLQITRDVATDTLGVDAQLIGCMIQYQESSTEQSAW